MQEYLKYAIIVAGGNGSRMQSIVPKQFLLLKELPVLMYTVQNFYNADPNTHIILVLPESQIAYWNELCEKYHFKIPCNLLPGGKTRFHSVKNGLNTISKNEGVVAIHDGVRPLTSQRLINNCFESAFNHKAAVPVVSLMDSLRKIGKTDSKAIDRALYRVVQTPQCFSLSLLKKAYQQPYQDYFTDDATVVEAFGHSIVLVDGENSNIKITKPEDLLLAEILIKKLV